MDAVTVSDANTRFSKYLTQVQAGESLLICRNGRPIGGLAPVTPERLVPSTKRRGGQLRGQIWTAPDFDAPDPERLVYDESPLTASPPA